MLRSYRTALIGRYCPKIDLFAGRRLTEGVGEFGELETTAKRPRTASGGSRRRSRRALGVPRCADVSRSPAGQAATLSGRESAARGCRAVEGQP
jgi:hypothetical protein